MNRRSTFRIINGDGDVKLFYLVPLTAEIGEKLVTSDYIFENEIDTNIFDLYERNQELQHQLEEKDKIIDEIEKYCKNEDKYWGNDSYINGKNEENKIVKKDILKILERGKDE